MQDGSMNHSIASFIDTLRDSRLLDPGKLDELLRTPEAQEVDAPTLGQCLIQLGWLTPFQVEELLQGQPIRLILGPYRILEKLGQDSVAAGYKARHPEKEGRFVIKLIDAARAADRAIRDRFADAVAGAAHLAHPNIARVGPLEWSGDQPVYVREYVEGLDLGRLVRETGPLPVAYVCDYLHQAALGLQHAHERGLAHGRLKPNNLIVAGTAGLIGAATANASEGTAALPPPGAVVKIVDFALAALDTADVAQPDSPAIRQDLSDLGQVLGYLLMGEGNAAPLSVPEGLQLIIARFLAEQPEDRFVRAADLAQALAPLCGGEPGSGAAGADGAPQAGEQVIDQAAPPAEPSAEEIPTGDAPAMSQEAPSMAEPALEGVPMAQPPPMAEPAEESAPAAAGLPPQMELPYPASAAESSPAAAEPSPSAFQAAPPAETGVVPYPQEAAAAPPMERPVPLPSKRKYGLRFWFLVVVGLVLHLFAFGMLAIVIWRWTQDSPAPTRPSIRVIPKKSSPRSELIQRVDERQA
jgi:hypothetical protein